MSARSPTDSSVETAHFILPSDINAHGTAFGGRIMQWMDIAAAIAASRHCGGVAATVAVDDLYFSHPIRLGDILMIRACVNYTGHSSMEVGVRVEREEPSSGQVQHCLSGYFTFVALDPQGHPMAVPALEPCTEVEKRRYTAAQHRRHRRLLNRQRLSS